MSVDPRRLEPAAAPQSGGFEYAAEVARAHLDTDSKFLLTLNAKATRTGSPVYAGVPDAVRQKRRAAGKVAKASRKANR